MSEPSRRLFEHRAETRAILPRVQTSTRMTPRCLSPEEPPARNVKRDRRVLSRDLLPYMRLLS